MSGSGQARLFLDVSIESKKGIDSELTLGSELHATKEVIGKSEISLKLKSGLKVFLKAIFAEDDVTVIGPSDRIRVNGRVYGEGGEMVIDFLKEPLIIVLGEKRKFSHSLKGEKIDITILPYIK